MLGPETALIATSAASTVELAASSAQMLAAGGAQARDLAEDNPIMRCFLPSREHMQELHHRTSSRLSSLG